MKCHGFSAVNVHKRARALVTLMTADYYMSLYLLLFDILDGLAFYLIIGILHILWFHVEDGTRLPECLKKRTMRILFIRIAQFTV